MPNINLLLKQEISRVARKELRSEIAALKKCFFTVPHGHCGAQAPGGLTGEADPPDEQDRAA